MTAEKLRNVEVCGTHMKLYRTMQETGEKHFDTTTPSSAIQPSKQPDSLTARQQFVTVRGSDNVAVISGHFTRGCQEPS